MHHCSEALRILRRHLASLHIPSHYKVHGLALAQHHLVGRPHHHIPKSHNRSSHSRQRCPYNQLIVVTRRRLIPCRHLGDSNQRVVLLLHILVVHPQLSNELHPPYLEPHQVIRVIHHAHLVGLGIPHPNPRLGIALLDQLLHIAHPLSLEEANRRSLEYRPSATASPPRTAAPSPRSSRPNGPAAQAPAAPLPDPPASPEVSPSQGSPPSHPAHRDRPQSRQWSHRTAGF